ncbi:PspC domain-containing protein [Carnobacterium inhibens]|uniref:PspC family transcriptional regulator n=1 Tax=Carnobacterium inhibens subsp. gilichinskyi TaxID=1266845 RepID=U5S734_9LACT|nr:PspC domain-containing protein [Carnobacterium inhibens]AGY81024.1 PspC family transcriptional regulator [Carnobacterium inhibens subsp. gilichinskyi]
MKKLTKSRDNKMVSGVLAGVAEYFGFDPTLLRIIYGAATLIGVGLPFFLYIVLAIVIPEAPRSNQPKNPTSYGFNSGKKRPEQPAARKEAEKVKEEDWSDF